jgi:transcriptional regulator GlxA family with amidase domain
MNVDVVVLDGVLDSALGVTRDILDAANRIARAQQTPPPFRWRTVGVTRTVTSGTGLRFQTDALFSSQQRPDALVVLGLNTIDGVEGMLRRTDVGTVMKAIQNTVKRRALLLAGCTATFLCAEAGVLNDGEASTSWFLARDFERRYPRVTLRSDLMVATGPSATTAGAALSQVDLMLWLVRKVAGSALARLVARYLVIDERPSQSRYFLVDHFKHQDARVIAADSWARKNLGQKLSVAELARRTHTTVRTLERSFQRALGLSPLSYLQRLRVEKAQHLLETTTRSVERIAESVALESATLRRIMRRELGVVPSQLRSRARAR